MNSTQLDFSTPSPAAVWPQTKVVDPNFAQNVPNCQIFQLASGLRVVIMSDQTDRSTYMQVFVNGGAIHQPNHPRGIAHFMEHILFQGTEKFTDIAAMIQYAKEFNLNWNGYVGSTEEGYHVECDNDDESIHAAATMLSQVVLHPTFPQDKIEKEKGVVLSERTANMSEPGDITNEEVRNHFFNQDHPIAGGGITGTAEDISQFNYEMITEFYRKHFTAQNLVLLIVGGKQINYYLDIAAQYFDSAPTSSWLANPLLSSVRKTTPANTSSKKDFNHINYLSGYFVPRSDWSRFSREDYIMDVVTGAMSTRIFLDIRDKQGLAYAAGVSQIFLYEGYFLCADAEFAAEKFKVAKPQLDSYLQRLVSEPITEAELKHELRAMRSARWANNARSIAMNAARGLFQYGQPISPEGENHLFDGLTVEEVQSTFERLIAGKELETIAVGAV